LKPRGNLTVQLGAAKDKWNALCKSQNTKPGTAIRQLVTTALSKNRNSDLNATELHEQPDESKERIEIRLTRTEMAKTRKHAENEGCSPNRWIINLVRANLTKRPQFGMKELEDLGESNKQLLAIGRNLNQLVRAINRGESRGVDPSQIQAISDLIKKHAEIVSTAMQANIDRWVIE